MRIQSDRARFLLWMSLIGGGGPFAGWMFGDLMQRYGFVVLPATILFGTLIAAAVLEVRHRLRNRGGA